MLGERMQVELREAIELDLRQEIESNVGSHVLEHDFSEFEFRWKNGQAIVRIQDPETLDETLYTFEVSVFLVSVVPD